MKEILKEMHGLTWKQRLSVIYFSLSFCLLFISDETPLWIVLLIILNFANAARIIKKVPLPEIE